MSYLTGQAWQLGIFDEDRTVLWRQDWAYQCRGVHLTLCASQYVGLWPSSKMCSGDPTSPLARLGQDICQGQPWGLWAIGNAGKGGPSVFLSGQTLNNALTPIAGVAVQGFVTSNDVPIGQVISDANGNYSLGSPFPGVAHYLVAYLPGSPDICGTTVDTLIPA